MRSLTSLVAGAALFAASATVILPTTAEALPVVAPAAVAPVAFPIEHAGYYYGRRLCFRRFGWHGPGLYRCHRWWGGYGWHRGFGWRHGYGFHRSYGFHGGRRFGGFHGGHIHGGHFGGGHRGGFGGRGFHGGGHGGGGHHR